MWPLQAPSRGTTLSILASSPQGSDPCLGASVFHLHLSCASVSRTCPKVSEKPKTGDWGGGGGLEMLKIFPSKLMATASLLYTISAFRRRYFPIGGETSRTYMLIYSLRVVCSKNQQKFTQRQPLPTANTLGRATLRYRSPRC